MNYFLKKMLDLRDLMKLYSIVIKETQDIKLLKEMYGFFKELNMKHGLASSVNDIYNLIVKYMLNSEKVFNNKQLLDTSFTLDIKKDMELNTDSEEQVLEYIVFQIRKKLLKTIYWNNIGALLNESNTWNPSLVNYCYNASINVKELCNKHKIKCYLLEIHPGYCKKAKLFKGNGFHYANIIKLKNYYLLDLTYSQFFNLGTTNLERIGLVNYPLTKAGRFMIMNEDRKKTALEILKKGYVKIDDNSIKNYFDGFTISYRNGLYYEQTKDYSYTTDYTIDDYFNFIMKKDNQILHEGKDVLGYQKKYHL